MKISFLGDSITFGYDLENKEDRFASLICKRLGAEEANFGITGTLMAKAGINRTDGNSFYDRLDLVMDGDITVIFGGTNDYFWSDTKIGDLTCKADCFYSAVNEMFKKISEKRNVKKTLIVTPYPHNGIGNFYGGKDSNDSSTHDTDAVNYNGHQLIDYVNTLEELAGKYGIPVLNLHEIPGFDWKKHTTDGCHPNKEGHIWLANQIENKIRMIMEINK